MFYPVLHMTSVHICTIIPRLRELDLKSIKTNPHQDQVVKWYLHSHIYVHHHIFNCSFRQGSFFFFLNICCDFSLADVYFHYSQEKAIQLSYFLHSLFIVLNIYGFWYAFHLIKTVSVFKILSIIIHKVLWYFFICFNTWE